MRHNLAEADFITEEEYLAREALADEKHEYLNGFVYCLHTDSITNMAGASDAQVKVTGNAHYTLKTHLRVSPCSYICPTCVLRLIAKTRHGSILMLWLLATPKSVNAIP